MANPEHGNFGNEEHQEPEPEVAQPQGSEPSSADYKAGYFDYGQIWHDDAPAPPPKEVSKNSAIPFKPDGSLDFDQMAEDGWSWNQPHAKPEQTAEDTSEPQPPDA